MEMKTIEDLNKVEDGARIRLTPNDQNPIHKSPVLATFSRGYFLCDGSNPIDGPDYYFRDVFMFNNIIEVVQ